MEEMNINATVRTGEGVKGTLSQIRAAKNVPAVIYGGHKEPISITISLKDLEKIVKAGKNTIVEVNLPEGKEQVLVKEVQYHVVTDLPIHADFQRVNLNEKMDLVVPVKLVGECADVKTHGAMIEHILRELEVRALVSNIPHEIEVDITGLTITSGILAGDIKLPAGVELLTDGQAPVVHLALPKEDAPAEAADPAAQPGSSSTKGKKDENGNLTKDAAKK